MSREFVDRVALAQAWLRLGIGLFGKQLSPAAYPPAPAAPDLG
jgi:hypothetical protein